MVTVNITLDLTADDIQNLQPDVIKTFVEGLQRYLDDNVTILVP